MNEGIVYQIFNLIDDEFYVGCTFKTVEKRLSTHKVRSKDPDLQNIKLYQKAKDVGWENMKIEEITKQTCTRVELRKYEGEYILKLNPTLNHRKTGLYFKDDDTYDKQRYLKDYKSENSDTLRDKSKMYRELNKEKLSVRRAEYYELNKEVVLSKCRKYYQNNKDKVLAYQKRYELENKEKISLYRADRYQQTKHIILQRDGERVVCDCGREVRRGGLLRHKSTTIHIKLMT